MTQSVNEINEYVVDYKGERFIVNRGRRAEIGDKLMIETVTAHNFPVGLVVEAKHDSGILIDAEDESGVGQLLDDDNYSVLIPTGIKFGEFVEVDGELHRKVARMPREGEKALIVGNTIITHYLELGSVATAVRPTDAGSTFQGKERGTGVSIYQSVAASDFVTLEPATTAVSHMGEWYHRDATEQIERGSLVIAFIDDEYGDFKEGDTFRVWESAVGRLYIVDNNGDRRYKDTISKNFTVLKPIEVKTTIQSKTIDETEEAPTMSETFTHNGQQYKTVKRQAQEGEKILIVAAWLHGERYKNGDVLTVRDSLDGGVRVVEKSGIGIVNREYVVLEKTEGGQTMTEAFMYEGQFYSVEKREAKDGEKILVSGALIGEKYNDGDVFTVRDSYISGVITTDGPGLFHSEYKVLVEKTEESRLLDHVANLAARVNVLENKVKELEEKAAPAPRPVFSVSDILTPSFMPTPQPPTRAEIIERAKKDVEELLRIGGDREASLPKSSVLSRSYYTIEFVVNKEKRAVTALVFRTGASGNKSDVRPYKVGVAKCAPDDCFNAEIGQAIAARRALGLEAKEEYITAPQPKIEDRKVGDVILHNGSRSVIISGSTAWSPGKAHMGSIAGKNGRIVDDSREMVTA